MTGIELIGLARISDREHQNTHKHLKRRKAAIKATFLYMVPVGGLEPPRPKATDFESRVATDIHVGSNTQRLTAKKQTRTVKVLLLELTEKRNQTK